MYEAAFSLPSRGDKAFGKERNYGLGWWRAGGEWTVPWRAGIPGVEGLGRRGGRRAEPWDSTTATSSWPARRAERLKDVSPTGGALLYRDNIDMCRQQ